MARIVIKTKSTRGEYKCGHCGIQIQPGSQYKSWQFRNSAKQFRCMAPGCSPRASELTQGQIGRVYELNERISDCCDDFRSDQEFDDFKSNLESIKEDAESLKDEFDENYNNMPESFQNGQNGELVQGRVDALESFIDELDSAIDNADWPDGAEDEDAECVVVDGSGGPCGMAKSDDRHTKGHEEFEHEFEAEEADNSDLVESIVGDFESMSCDCD